MDQADGEFIQGAKLAAEIYVAAGIALSWWEASEDILMGFYRNLVGRREPLAFETYVGSTRGARSRMLKAALQVHKSLFVGDELEQLEQATKALDRLAQLRNQIAHGHCSNFNQSVEGKVTMSGHFLLPSFNEGVWMQRSSRYYHTPSTMAKFTEDVRTCRGMIMDVDTAVMVREQDRRAALDDETRALSDLIDQAARGGIRPQRLKDVFQLKLRRS